MTMTIKSAQIVYDALNCMWNEPCTWHHTEVLISVCVQCVGAHNKVISIHS